MTKLTIEDLVIPSYCGLCVLRPARTVKGAYDLHFERTLAEPNLPGQGPRVLAAIRPRLATLGYRPRWNGEQRCAIRIEPGSMPPSLLHSVRPARVLERWNIHNACLLGRAWLARFVSAEAALLTAKESGPSGNTDTPAGFARWLAETLASRVLVNDYSLPGWTRTIYHQNLDDSETHRDAISYLREAARWASLPRGEVGVA